MGQPSNAVMAKAAGAKRAAIPFTIATSATIASIVASIDGEFAGNAEIFVASATGANQAPSRGGNGGAATSALDPSCTPMNLSCDTAPISLGFVVLDGPSEKQPSNIPLAGDGKNPTYGTPAPRGDAKHVYAATVLITDGSDTSVPVATDGVAARADVQITPNGNMNIRVTFPKVAVITHGAPPISVIPTLKVAGQTVKGYLFLEWF